MDAKTLIDIIDDHLEQMAESPLDGSYLRAVEETQRLMKTLRNVCTEEEEVSNPS